MPDTHCRFQHVETAGHAELAQPVPDRSDDKGRGKMRVRGGSPCGGVFLLSQKLLKFGGCCLPLVLEPPLRFKDLR